MDKLEVGMYVRTKDGDVFILDKIEDNHLIPRYVYIPYIIIEADVKKTSHNIIDLIEVGDYVNGLIVNDVVTDIDGTKTFNLFKQLSYFGNEDIKSIVTKEQFKNMEYRIGD